VKVQRRKYKVKIAVIF